MVTVIFISLIFAATVVTLHFYLSDLMFMTATTVAVP